MSPHTLVYGRTTAAERGIVTTYEASWPEICELFREPARRKITSAQYAAMSAKDRSHSKNTGLFFGGRCRDGHRNDQSLESRSIVNLDLDDHCQEIWDEYATFGTLTALNGLSYLIHTTRSHTDATPKMRILVPLAHEISAAEYEPVARALAEMLDPTMNAVARESYTPAQGMYFPSVSADQGYEFAAFEGTFFDPAAALAKYPADEPALWPKRQKEKVTVYVPGRKMTHPEDKKAQAPIIAAVHRCFHPADFIDEFLGDIYIQSGDRYYPVGATGAPSVRVYDDAFIQSDHGSDPAVGQHNTFDLGRIHLFRELDADYDTESLSPVEWPSYKAMEEFMLKRPEVRAALADIEAEIAEERNRGMLDMLDSLGDDFEDDEDLIGGELDDLIGESPTAKKGASIEDVLRRVRKSIANAKTLDDLDRRLEIIRAFPTADFSELYRDLVAADVQKAFIAISGDKITKAAARKMLAPTIENLRAQAMGEELPAWIKNWVYVTSENKFLNLETGELLPREGFNGALSIPTGERFGLGNTGMPIIQPADAAISVFDVPKPYKVAFHPGKGTMYEDEGQLLVNSYRGTVVTSGGYKGNEGVKLLKRLLTDLFPDKIHRALVMDFIAHCVRFPDRKLKYALLIKGSENEGKTMLGDLVSELLGQHNCSLIGNDQLKEKFNGWSHERLFCVVEEIRVPGREAHEVLNKLKPIITNRAIAVRKMNKDVERVLNFCNLYITTNHEDCLPLEEDNSRFLVLFTRFRTNAEVKAWHRDLIAKEGRIYTRDLWDHIHERPAQFLEAISKYEFSEFYDPQGRAPDTVFKQIMAEDAKSEERDLLEGMLDSREDPTITPEVLLWSSFRTILDRKNMAPALRNRAVASFLKPLGFVRVKKTTVRREGDVKTVSAWTKDMSLLDSDYAFTNEGRKRLLSAVEAREELDGLDELVSNVVPFRPKK